MKAAPHNTVMDSGITLLPSDSVNTVALPTLCDEAQFTTSAQFTLSGGPFTTVLPHTL